MDQLTQKILENARRRRENMASERKEKENENTSKLVSPMIQRFEKRTYQESQAVIPSTEFPKQSIKERIESIQNCSLDSPKKEPLTKIKKEIVINSKNAEESPSKLIESPFLKFNIVKESSYKSFSDKNSPPCKKIESVEANIVAEQDGEKLHSEGDREKELNNDPLLQKKKYSIKINTDNDSSDNDVNIENNMSSTSSISVESNIYIPTYPKISEISGSTIGSSMILSEEIEDITIPKPIKIVENSSQIKENPKNTSFPSTPNTPKIIIVEEILTDQLKYAKPNDCIKSRATTSTMSNAASPQCSKNFSTKAHTLASSTSSLVSFDGCLLHNQRVYDDTLANIKKNIFENQSIIHQTSQALSIAYLQNKNKNFLSKEMIEAERLSLLACQKRKYYTELEEKALNRNWVCRCSKNEQNYNYYVNVSLKDFSLFIKNDYFHSYDADLGVYQFCFVISHQNKIFATNAVSINDIEKSALVFSGSFNFPNIDSSQFIKIQLFVLTHLNEGQRPSTVFKKLKIGKLDLTPKISRSKKSTANSPLVSDILSATNSSNFIYIGEVNCPVDKTGLMKMSLSNIVFDSPITGSFTLYCESEPIDSCMAKGFLTYYSLMGNSVSWQRYWCGLFKDHLSLWLYPRDENTKNPVKKIKLKWFEDAESIRSVPIEECSRKDTFELQVIEPNANNAKGFLESSHLFAADSSEEKKKWIDSFIMHIKKSKTLKIGQNQSVS